MRLTLRCTALALLFAAAPAGALTFTKIAGDGLVGVYYGPPALDDGLVAFLSIDANQGVTGIYTSSGGTVTTVADTTMNVPGRPQKFIDFQGPSLSDGNVAFSGHGGGSIQGTTRTFGIYASFGGGPLTEIAGAQRVVPNPYPPGTLVPYEFSQIPPTIEGTQVAFVGNVDATRSIYKSSAGGLEVVFDDETPLPSGGFADTMWPRVSIDATGIVFQADTDDPQGGTPKKGLYFTSNDGVTRVIADRSTLVPGTNELFYSLSVVDSDEGNTLFAGASSGAQKLSLFAEIGGVLMWIADAPAGQFLQEGSISGNGIAWSTVGCPSVSSCNQSIHALVDGQSAIVIQSGDVFDGRVVQHIGFGQDALSGNQLALTVDFTDSTSAVYLADFATIPEPGSGLLVASGLLALGRGRRRDQLDSPRPIRSTKLST